MATITRTTVETARTETVPAPAIARTTTVTKTVIPKPYLGPARGWLKTLGWASILLGILGLVGYVVDVAHDYAFHLESGQMVFHWLLGIGCLVAAYAVRPNVWLGAASITAGAILIAVGLFGFMDDGVGAWHAGAGDSVMHLLFGLVSVLVGIVSINRERELGSRRTTISRTV
jgi:hypothetical protein